MADPSEILAVNPIAPNRDALQARGRDIAFLSWDDIFAKLPEGDREYLRATISAADDEQLKEKVTAFQKGAYAVFPYRCIRAFRFVVPTIARHPAYPAVLAAGRAGRALFLDLGCCTGAETRRLAHDGYPAQNVLGSDLEAGFIDLGYELFRDRASCKIRFFPDDVFKIPLSPAAGPDDSDTISSLAQLCGRVDHLYTAAVFHLFDEATQRAMAQRVARLVKRARGTVLFGRHRGQAHAGPLHTPAVENRYGHSPASWAQLWKAVFAELEGAQFAEERVEVSAQLSGSGTAVEDEVSGRGMLYWSVRIV